MPPDDRIINTMKSYTTARHEQANRSAQRLAADLDALGFSVDPSSLVTLRLDTLTEFVLGSMDDPNVARLEFETDFTESLVSTLEETVRAARQAKLTIDGQPPTQLVVPGS